MLIVPVDRPELLSIELDDPSANRIRDDLFKALTQIPRHADDPAPYYLPSTDEVVWFAHDVPRPGEAIRFPAATFEQEIADRKEFIDSPEVNLPHTAKSTLSIALESSSPLGAFSFAVKELDISSSWHRYRMSAILMRLRRWSSEKNIRWSPHWIAEVRPKPSDVPAAEQIAVQPVVPVVVAREFLGALASVITEEDLARIQVPLDLVVKAWPSSRG
ncbi:MAG: hypothetical protein HHJ17_15590 [Rhodoferax sp.]|uniref:hypothetical protein n=1 Tax=Rhodoferax sp. TaxID=50421 RepID=UPI00185A744A|nr:hypothetical protein [Rhodoferax sp.]NMM14943.1 hypothetical protein [Rhodoferax sp.]